MVSRVVKSKHDLDTLVRFLTNHDRPFTVSITKGKRRSIWQNRLQRLWCNEISEQLRDQTPEEVRGLLKLQYGVPILRAENEAFCEKYDAVVKPLPYWTKLAIMQEPLDMPVTRIMTVAQLSKYLDAVYKDFTEKGLILTTPNDNEQTKEA